MLSDRVLQIKLSTTMHIAAKAISMKASGINIVDLSVGEPDFATPQHIKKAAVEAIKNNHTKYTVNSGKQELKQAIIDREYLDHGVTYNLDEIIISSGAKNSLYNSCLSLIDEGDEVIIPAPYWPTYPNIVHMAKGIPIIVNTSENSGFHITPEQIRDVLTNNTKAIIINNPSNPTGAVYGYDDLKKIVEIAIEKGIYIISDEVYGKLVYDNFEFKSVAAINDKIKKQCVVINGVSKSYAMTGWRVGYAAGPKEVIEAAAKIQCHNTSNACTISQMAAITAFNGPQEFITDMLTEYQKRRLYMYDRIMEIPNVSCNKSEGAFYLFPNLSAYYNTTYKNQKIINSTDLTYYLLDHAHVAIVPGAGFGADNFMRLSYSTSIENIKQGMDRIIEALDKLTLT